jgi:type VI secretion system protein ImpC
MPFSIGVVGDFSGRGRTVGAGGGELGERVPILVDADNVLRLAGIRPELTLSLGGDADELVSMSFQELEDFHPDRLVEAVPLFADLMATRRRPADPGTFRQAMSELAAAMGGDEAAEPEASGITDPSVAGTGLLDAIVEETAVEPPSAREAVRSGLDRYVRQLVRPHLVAEGSPEQAEMLAGLDSAIGATMRALLHHPDFQHLEGAWRSVLSLVSRALAVESRIRVYLIDVSLSEIASDLLGDGDLKSTGLFRALAGEMGGAPDGSPWSVLLGFEPLGTGVADVALASRIAELSAMFGVSWMSNGDASGLAAEIERRDARTDGGSRSTAEWDAFRGAPAARSLGMVVPRVLSRLPYGEDSEPCEVVRFEELSEGEPETDYLWGDSAHLCALTLARLAFGRSAPTGLAGDFDGFPVHIREVDGIATTRPCCEVLITDDSALELMARGFTPVQSGKEQGLARVLRIQSVAAPTAPLTFWWTGKGVFGG